MDNPRTEWRKCYEEIAACLFYVSNSKYSDCLNLLQSNYDKNYHYVYIKDCHNNSLPDSITRYDGKIYYSL